MKYLWGFSGSILLLMIGYNTYQIQESKKKKDFVYVVTKDVFDGFIFKQEMEQKYKLETKNSSTYLDSLAFEIQLFSGQLEGLEMTNEETQKLKTLKSLYYQKRSYYENFANELTQTYDSQILTQMKQYIKEYGEENNHQFVLGVSEDGLVLYGEKMNDVTAEVIEYINIKYQGE